jgi:tetratricopeptide (TPR) repeat protein
LLLLALLPAGVQASGRSSRRQMKAQREAALKDSLAFEQARDEARRDYFYHAALQNRLAQGLLQSSFEMMRHAAEIDSTSAPVSYSLAEYYERLGDLNSALSLSSKAARTDTANLWYGLKEAGLLKQMKRPEEAIASYERLLRSNPDNMQICDQLLELYVGVDSLRPCLRLLDHVEELEGLDPRLTMQKFYLYMQVGEPDSAFAVTQRLVDRYPYNADYRIVQGDLMLKAGRLEDAKASYDAAEKLDKNNAMLWLSQANYYNAVGENRRADSLVRAAVTHPDVELDTKIDILTDYLRANLSAQRDSLPETENEEQAAIDTLFAAVSAMHPTAPEPYELHAQYLAVIGRDSLAIRCYRDAIDLQPSEKSYWSGYLQLIAHSEDTTLLRTAAEEAKQIHPDLLETYLYLAQLDVMQDRATEGMAEYRSALEQVPEAQKGVRSRLYGYLGDLYQHEAEMDSAYYYYDISLQYNPENVYVLNNYSYFLALENRDLDKAERMISTAVRLQPDESTYLDTYAWVYFKQGNFMLAKFYQKRAIDKAEEQSATLLEHYGDILSCSGDAAGALEYWQKAADLGKSTPTLLEKLRTGAYIEEPFDPKNP